jgi:hypothetical protein
MSSTTTRRKPTAKQLDHARNVLARALKGEPVTIEQINAALLATGDLEHVDCSLAEVAA